MLEDYFPVDAEREGVSKLIKIFHDDMLLDEGVSDVAATVLVVYMAANKEKTNSPNKNAAQELFERLGRTGTKFSKAVYEVINRKNPPLLKETNDRVGLTFAGKVFVEKILSGGDLDD